MGLSPMHLNSIGLPRMDSKTIENRSEPVFSWFIEKWSVRIFFKSNSKIRKVVVNQKNQAVYCRKLVD
jgi:hypothetical protein